MKSNSKNATNDAMQIVRALIERAINEGQMDAIPRLVHANYRYHSPNETLEGADQLIQLFHAYRAAFPDLKVTINEQFASAEKVCTRLTLTGTNHGSFLGASATQRSVEVSGVVISRVIDGRITEEWELIDELSLSRQLGLITAS